MTDPERLLSGGTAFEQSVLGEAALEKPSPAMLARMEQGLGLGASSVAASTVSGKLVLAVLGTGAAGGLVVWGLVATPDAAPVEPVTDARDVAAQVATPEVGAVVEPERPSEPKTGAASAPPQAQIEDLPLVSPDAPALAPRSVTRRVRTNGPAEAPAANGDQLKLEVQQLDRVRAALGTGDRERALQLLDGYERRFPNGTLAPEAAKLRHSARR